MAKGLPRQIAERAERDGRVVPEATLSQIREKAKELRDAMLKVDDLTHSLEDATAEMNRIKTKELPEMMEGVQITSLVVEKDGNHPAFEVRSKAFYSAGIPVTLPPEQREVGFNHLIERGGGDLIKTTVSFDFPKESHAIVARFVAMIEKLQDRGEDLPNPVVRMTVHHASLASWLREEIETSTKSGKDLPDLGKLNATVGKVAEIKVKEEK